MAGKKTAAKKTSSWDDPVKLPPAATKTEFERQKARNKAAMAAKKPASKPASKPAPKPKPKPTKPMGLKSRRDLANRLARRGLDEL